MFGFVLAIGIVVDDAIVVVEAVQHYMDSQKISAREATEKAYEHLGKIPPALGGVGTLFAS